MNCLHFLLLVFSPLTTSSTSTHTTLSHDTVTSTDRSSIPSRGSLRERNLTNGPPQSPTSLHSSSEIYDQIRLKSEQNCLIPHAYDEDNNYKDDPRTVLDKSKRCLIYYLHIHKSGGTTICSTIRHQGFNSNQKENCLPDRPFYNHEFEYSMEHNYNFIAQESPYFHPNLTNTQMLYMTTIRHPYDRIISHLHHEFCNRKEADAIERIKQFDCNFDIRTATLPEIILSNCFNGTMEQMTSNYYLRMFTNCIASKCTEEHLQKAIEKLNIMSVVMITDTPELYAKYDTPLP
jgi:hypothetical protein